MKRLQIPKKFCFLMPGFYVEHYQCSWVVDERGFYSFDVAKQLGFRLSNASGGGLTRMEFLHFDRYE